ncbi:MAG: DUF5606 domain-containing protein [Bacteroidia bacterium]|nr:DUF5606 domain-containing protein [Bacteroidia bacterium]
MKKINIEKIIAVSGIPGLYKIISNGTKGVIVENIIDKKRTIVLNNSKIFSLDTIGFYVSDGERSISEILYNLYEVLNHQMAPHHKNSSDEEVEKVFSKAVPDYDKDKVHINNMRKLFQWYNILHQANLLEVVEDQTADGTNEVSNTSDNSEASKKEKTTSKSDNTEQADASKSSENVPKKRGRKKKSENE